MEEIICLFEKLYINLREYMNDNVFDGIELNYKLRDDYSREIVSSIDKKVEIICEREIRNFSKEFKILSEESYLITNTDNLKDKFFVIDPIDGTKDMINGGDNWSISIAFIINNQTEIGSLFFPKKNKYILAIKDKGCFMNNIIINKNTINNNNIAVSPKQNIILNLEELFSTINMNTIPIPSLTSKILAIIEGEVSNAIYFPKNNRPVKIWDYSAAYLIIKEFGGNMKSILADKPITFTPDKINHEGGWIAFRENKDFDNIISLINGFRYHE